MIDEPRSMIEISDPAQMRSWSRTRRAEGRSVGFVPTMGYLHEGHLRLVDRAQGSAALVVVSAFVNPLQFGPGEDFERYPRDAEHDREAAVSRGVACLFIPGQPQMYASPAVVRVNPGPLADHLCGPRRPGHFEGVLTVVAKLLHMVEPDVAVFGRKDAQQALIIRRMVRDLNFPTTIEIAPTIREPDGLALSSRNVYLTADQRRAAPALARGLEAAHLAFAAGERRAARIVDAAEAVIRDARGIELEYLTPVDPGTLQPVSEVEADTILAVAARLGKARLIDNIELGRGIGSDEWLEAASA